MYEGSLWDLLHEPCWESNDPIECNLWLGLELTGPEGRKGLRKDMVNVVFDTLTDEVKSMLLNEDGTKAIVYVTQPYMNLNVAGELRDEIDGMLSEEQDLEGTRTSLLTGGLPVSLDINKGIHDTQNQTTIIHIDNSYYRVMLYLQINKIRTIFYDPSCSGNIVATITDAKPRCQHQYIYGDDRYYRVWNRC